MFVEVYWHFQFIIFQSTKYVKTSWKLQSEIKIGLSSLGMLLSNVKFFLK